MDSIIGFCIEALGVFKAALAGGALAVLVALVGGGSFSLYEHTFVAWWCGDDDRECAEYWTDFSCPDEFPECNSPAYTGS
jgi:hypothetical protein